MDETITRRTFLGGALALSGCASLGLGGERMKFGCCCGPEMYKGSDPLYIFLEDELKRIDCLLNDRPLRCLNWRTPREAFNALRSRYLVAA